MLFGSNIKHIVGFNNDGAYPLGAHEVLHQHQHHSHRAATREARRKVLSTLHDNLCRHPKVRRLVMYFWMELFMTGHGDDFGLSSNATQAYSLSLLISLD